ncbi:MAG: hypothetical protein KAH18_06240 [Psychromonas sp.]|nr:hypothetical protein [Psychromonas sp.]
MLDYLWLYDCALVPLEQPDKSYLYSFPLLTCWDGDVEDENSFLMAIKHKLWLENK